MKAALALLGLACLAACAGPRPRVVSSVQLALPAGSEVEVVIENTGGEGQALVEVTAHSTAGAVVRADRDVSLRPGERLTVRLPLDLRVEDTLRLDVRAAYP